MAEAPGPTPEGEKEHRIALVVGNAKYLSGRPLINTDADAIGVADALTLLGFVSHNRSDSGEDQPLEAMHDQTLMEMKRALAEFSVASRDADMSIIYYSGHGIEINFENFLIPVDATLKNTASPDYEAVPLAEVMGATEGARKLRLVILDACRDNPLVSGMDDFDPEKSGTSRRIGKPRLPAGALTFYAAAEGQTAKQGSPGGRSPFADSLIARMLEPEEINRVFGLVAADVKKKTNETQEPRLYGSPLAQAVYLVPTEINEPGFDRPFPIPPPRRRDDQKKLFHPRRFIAAASFTLIAAIAVIWTFPVFFWRLVQQRQVEPSKIAPVVPTISPKIEPAFHVRTTDIVNRIRCETRLAMQDQAIAELSQRNPAQEAAKNLSTALSLRRGSAWIFDGNRLGFFPRYLRMSVTFDFFLNIPETVPTGSPDFPTNNHPQRLHLSETFQQLLSDISLSCGSDAVFGRIGIDNVISTFVDLSTSRPIASKGGPPFETTLTFTTPVSSSPITRVLIEKSFVEASPKNASEPPVDKHTVVIGLSFGSPT